MNKYELVIILDAALATPDKESIYGEVKDTVNKVEGKIINDHVWLERQKLTFPIKKKFEGTYYLVNFEGKPSTAVKLRDLLKLNERLLRSAIYRAEN